MTQELVGLYNVGMSLQQTFRAEGERIAQEIGEGVIYNGPQEIRGIPLYHTFTDEAVTGTTFAGLTLIDSKAALMVHRINHRSPLPDFPDVTDPIGTVRKLEEQIQKALDQFFAK